MPVAVNALKLSYNPSCFCCSSSRPPPPPPPMFVVHTLDLAGLCANCVCVVSAASQSACVPNSHTQLQEFITFLAARCVGPPGLAEWTVDRALSGSCWATPHLSPPCDRVASMRRPQSHRKILRNDKLRWDWAGSQRCECAAEEKRKRSPVAGICEKSDRIRYPPLPHARCARCEQPWPSPARCGGCQVWCSLMIL